MKPEPSDRTLTLAPEEPTRRKVAYYVALVVMLLAFASAATFIVWTLQPTDVITITKKPSAAKYSTLNGNKVVDVVFDFCVNSQREGQVSYSFVSSSTELLVPSSPAVSKVGCRKDVHAVIPVPKQTPPDRYHIHFKAEYKINPVKTSITEWDSEEFEVE